MKTKNRNRPWYPNTGLKNGSASCPKSFWGRMASPLPSTSPRFKRILTPIDLSQQSIKTLRYAVPFAERFASMIYLLQIIEPASLDGFPDEVLAQPGDALAEEFRKKLYSLANEEIGELVSVNCQVRIGKPAVEIATAAILLEVDLIIVSSCDYSTPGNNSMGVTTEALVRNSPCPLLVLCGDAQAPSSADYSSHGGHYGN